MQKKIIPHEPSDMMGINDNIRNVNVENHSVFSEFKRSFESQHLIAHVEFFAFILKQTMISPFTYKIVVLSLCNC